MSTGIILELSNATARSKGQALRRLQPSLSEECRKTRRKLLRQQRLEAKRHQVTKQTKPSEPVSSLASCRRQLQHHLPETASERNYVHRPREPLPGNFPDLVARGIDTSCSITLADGPTSTYLKKLPRVQINEDESQFSDQGKSPDVAEYNGEYRAQEDRLTPADEILDIATDRDLMVLLGLPTSPSEWTSAPRPVSLVISSEELPLDFRRAATSEVRHSIVDVSGPSAKTEYYQCCHNPLCEYAHRLFWSKSARDQHLLDHHGTLMTCGFCPKDSTLPSHLNEFKDHLSLIHGVVNYKIGELVKDIEEIESFNTICACATCPSLFQSPQEFSEHLDACVVRYLEQRSPQRWVNLMLKATPEDQASEELVLEVYGKKYYQ